MAPFKYILSLSGGSYSLGRDYEWAPLHETEFQTVKLWDKIKDS